MTAPLRVSMTDGNDPSIACDETILSAKRSETAGGLHSSENPRPQSDRDAQWISSIDHEGNDPVAGSRNLRTR